MEPVNLQQRMGYEELGVRVKLLGIRKIGLGDYRGDYLIKKRDKVIRRMQLQRIMSSGNDGFR